MSRGPFRVKNEFDEFFFFFFFQRLVLSAAVGFRVALRRRACLCARDVAPACPRGGVRVVLAAALVRRGARVDV